MNAEAEHTRKVSTNTPKDWIRPCLTGWLASAVAAAFGTEPSPASLENKPRLIPFITAAPKKPPAAASKLKALEKIA